MTINYNWLDQQQTAFIVWTVIYAWYSILPFAHPVDEIIGGMGHGLMSATQPWSGHYRIQPTLYVLAHTTQFVRPGCNYINATATLSGGKYPTGTVGSNSTASAVAFTCPDDRSITIVVETGDAVSAITAHFTLTAGADPLPSRLRVWETCAGAYFVQRDDVVVDGSTGVVAVALQPQCMYTLSSAQGQSAVPAADIASPARFPMPYKDNFDSYADQGTVKYFTDQGGSFNAAPSPSGDGMALQQVVTQRPIEWGHNPDPFTIAGDSQTWANSSVSVQVWIASVSPLPPSPPNRPVFVLNTTSLQPCSGKPAQQFSLVGSQLKNLGPGNGCLGSGHSDKDFTGNRDAALVPCNVSDTSQQWSIARSLGGSGHVRLRFGGACGKTDSDGCCLNLDGGRVQAGGTLLLWECNTQPFENWIYDPSSRTIGYGDTSRGNYCVAADARVGPPEPPGPPPADVQPSATSAKVCGRIGSYSRGGSPPAGVCLLVDHTGNWFLVDGGGSSGTVREHEHVLAHGQLPGSVQPMKGWVTLAITFSGNTATATVNEATLATVDCLRWATGMVGVGSGWNQVFFDNLQVTAL